MPYTAADARPMASESSAHPMSYFEANSMDSATSSPQRRQLPGSPRACSCTISSTDIVNDGDTGCTPLLNMFNIS